MSMKLHKAPVLETLRIHSRPVDAIKWIANAVDRHVRVLELKLLRSRTLIKLPESLYTCKTLCVQKKKISFQLVFSTQIEWRF